MNGLDQGNVVLSWAKQAHLHQKCKNSNSKVANIVDNHILIGRIQGTPTHGIQIFNLPL